MGPICQWVLLSHYFNGVGVAFFDTFEWKQVNDYSRTIVSAVEEQSATTREISRNIAETAQASEVVSTNVEEMAIATGEITKNIVKADINAKKTALSASETSAAGEGLNQLSSELHKMTSRF